MDGGVLRFRLAGFPVSIHWSFFLVVALLGWVDFQPALVAIFVVSALSAVLAHELGHAAAARRHGAQCSIELYYLGGLTRWRIPGGATRGQALEISLAGPATGLAIGLVVYLVYTALGPVSYYGRVLVFDLLWTHVGWGLLNLVPVPPLDGGHALEATVRDPRLRTRISLASAASIAVLLLLAGQLLGAIVFGYLAWATYQGGRPRLG